MIRLILFVVVGLLAGLGAGTGVAVLKAKSAFAAQTERRAKFVADSIAEHAQKKPEAKPEHAPDSATAAADSSASSMGTTAGEHPAPSGVAGTDAAAHADGVTKPTEHAKASAKTPAKTATDPQPKAATMKAPVAPGGGNAPATAAVRPAQPKPATVERAPVTTAATRTDDVAQPKRISKIFAAMPPRDAAKVLLQMDDADIQLIMQALGEKQAAAILVNFPPDRAATISRKSIGTGKTP